MLPSSGVGPPAAIPLISPPLLKLGIAYPLSAASFCLLPVRPAFPLVAGVSYGTTNAPPLFFLATYSVP